MKLIGGRSTLPPCFPRFIVGRKTLDRVGFQFVAVACIERSVGDSKYNAHVVPKSLLFVRCESLHFVDRLLSTALSSSIAWGRQLGDRKK